MCVYIYIYIYMHVMSVYIYACYLCVYIYIYIYIYIYMRPHMRPLQDRQGGEHRGDLPDRGGNNNKQTNNINSNNY